MTLSNGEVLQIDSVELDESLPGLAGDEQTKWAKTQIIVLLKVKADVLLGQKKKKGFVSFLPIEGVLNNKQVFDQVSRTFPSSKSVSLFLANGRFAATTAKKKTKKTTD